MVVNQEKFYNSIKPKGLLIKKYLLFFFKIIHPKYKPRIIRAVIRYQSNNNTMKIPEYQKMLNEQLNSPAMQQLKEKMKAELRAEMQREQSGATPQTVQPTQTNYSQNPKPANQPQPTQQSPLQNQQYQQPKTEYKPQTQSNYSKPPILDSINSNNQNTYSNTQSHPQSNHERQEEEMKKKIRELREGL